MTDSAVPARGRYAPSPSGDIHLGNARTALVAWLSARVQRGAFIWRIEDLDQPRTVPGMAERQLEDLAWLGLDWDRAPDQGGAHPERQSERTSLYLDALRLLEEKSLLFPCGRSRSDLAQLATAPHGAAARTAAYPKNLRPEILEAGWLDSLLAAPAADASVRFVVPDHEIEFTDRLLGTVAETLSESSGDFVVRRRDGVWSYQLAVVVDDHAQQVTEVVRGSDLLDSTARQIALQRALDARSPEYLHVPLLLAEDGRKLSKRDQSLRLRTLRDRGWRSAQVVGLLAMSLGLRPTAEPTSARDLLDGCDLESLSTVDRRDHTVITDEGAHGIRIELRPAGRTI